ncbi:hypothetical protein [Streptomyces sp. CBMA123]|uniref:hypothetical protein n=1 Tax=Streptomyces sp. CBMA123 TaxID=1896313 RepID=UPI001661EEA3|nr:hypothetical protein [Streptomyces sp. CBMA123]MBD0689637.1 hypothetical protein [Streptomyces sp. CBMA123]
MKPEDISPDVRVSGRDMNGAEVIGRIIGGALLRVSGEMRAAAIVHTPRETNIVGYLVHPGGVFVALIEDLEISK